MSSQIYRSNWLFWGAYVVNAKTANPEKAFELLTRLTSVDVQSQVTALGANIPSRAGEDAVKAFLGSLTDVKADLNNQAFVNGLAYAVAEGKPVNAAIQKRGEPDKTGPEVPRRFLGILGGQALPPNHAGSGRLELAHWITDRGNPLTARVAVNRIRLHLGHPLV